MTALCLFARDEVREEPPNFLEETAADVIDIYSAFFTVSSTAPRLASARC